MVWHMWRVCKVKNSVPELFTLSLQRLEYPKVVTRNLDSMFESSLRALLDQHGISREDADDAIKEAREVAEEAA